MLKKCTVLNVGLIDYDKAWELQRKIFNARLEKKIGDVFIICEHPHTYTIGKSGSEDHLLVDEIKLNEQNIKVYRIDRGGDITYHGPGQIVGYPILDLNNYYLDIHRYLRDIEEVIIKTLKDYEIESGRIKGLTGVWVGNEKICAIGIKVSRWITMHGFAFNVSTDLSLFNNIIPCGINDKSVTSLEKLLFRKIDMNEVIENVIKNFSEIFKVITVYEPDPELWINFEVRR
jgi:lipoyl(octanoyl) transferase